MAQSANVLVQGVHQIKVIEEDFFCQEVRGTT
jgi:hypothetical protein